MIGYLRNKLNMYIVNNLYSNNCSKKAFILKTKSINKLGNNVDITARIMGPIFLHGKLSVGKNSFIGTNFHCEGNGHIKVGENCDIAPQVTVLTGTHHIGSRNRRAGAGITKDVIIGNGSWIGACSIILPGVVIGSGCIIGAGALVTRDVPDNCKAIGVPAKIIPISEKEGF